MTCPNFPGYYQIHSGEYGVFKKCCCPECQSEWPCPQDLVIGDLVEVVSGKDVYVGQVLSLQPHFGWFGLSFTVYGDDTCRMVSDTLVHWRRWDESRRFSYVPIEPRWDRPEPV